MKKNLIILLLLSIILLSSCRTVDFERDNSPIEESTSTAKNYEEELKQNNNEVQNYLIQEQVKEVDIPKTIIYVEKPIYYPATEPSELDRPDLHGKAAAKKSTESSIQNPNKFTNGIMYYDFSDDCTYEIYCQPYRVTDLMLEPGEQVIEMPFLSEDKVWEIGAGVSRVGGIDTQHFFLKPSHSNLTTSLIIITDKRVYHILLKSFSDCYMTQVKWKYPNLMPFTVKTEAMQERINSIKKETFSVDPRFLSFDYKMSYSLFRKPYWLPSKVYDDGRRTYVVMNETVLHMTSPVMFNNRNERINYSVEKNLIIINELIEKITLRVGSEKVTIKKKTYKEPTPELNHSTNTKPEEESPVPQNHPAFIDSMNSRLQPETMLHSSNVIVERPKEEPAKELESAQVELENTPTKKDVE